MPNKESFTFSDKLRKSKSVPLSKRLPSIVGGKNTQKRTLVQRAQRDLPFILVAALALLLLPFLSRTGSDDIAGTGDLAWNTMADAPSFSEGGGADIMPAGAMQDPLDLILRPRSDMEGSAVTMGADASKSAYGSSDEDGTGSSGYSRSRTYSTTGSSSTKRPDYTTRKSYDSEYTKRTTKAPATTTYGKKTRANVRKSFERKGTDINRALRVSQMAGGKGGSGVSYSLPIGQGPTRGGGTAFREGIRPVALQPMEARGGVGRSMTGENLYAEAARSARAMNAGGPAKANLLAAQMRDVDGQLTPESAGFGGPGMGAGVRPPGAGGGPGNTNGYSLGKPWWWDMMQARSQKMWDLYYYTPRKMFWENLYKIGLGFFNCLATGDKDGDVSTLFGKKAGKDDMECVRRDMLSLNDFIEQYGGSKTTSNKDGGKETETYASEGLITKWQQLCDPTMNEKSWKYNKGSRKTALQVRMECLGLDYKRMKGWFKAKSYGANCSHVNNDPLEFTYSVTKNGKTKERLEKKAVIALVAKVNSEDAKGEKRHILEGTNNYYYKLKGQEIIVYTQVGTKLSMSSEALDEIRDSNICTLTKVIGFVPRADRGVVNKQVDKANYRRLFDEQDITEFDDAYRKQNPVEVDKNGHITKRYSSAITAEEEKLRADEENSYSESDVNNLARFRGQVQAAQRICTGKATTSDVHPLTLNSIYDLADFVSQDGLFNSGVKNNSYKECKIWDKKPEFKKYINGVECTDCVGAGCVHGISILENTTFSATITNSKDKHVYAVLVDNIDQQTKAIASTIIDFNASGAQGAMTCTGNDCTFTFNANAASLGANQKLMGDTVVDPGSSSSSSSNWNSTNNADARDKQSRDQQAVIGTLTNECADLRKQCNGKSGDDYTTCMNSYNNCISGIRSGNYQGDSQSSSDGTNNPNTARGSGVVFWIVTQGNATFKIHQGDAVADNTWMVNIDDIIESSQSLISSICRYAWCNDVAQCDIPRQQSKTEVCFNTKDEKYHYYTKVNLDGENLLIPTTVAEGYTPNGEEPFCDNLCREGNEIICPKRKMTLDEAKKVLKIDPNDIPLCTPYCEYKGKVYDATLIDGKYYIIDATERKVNLPKIPKCSPLAWAWEDGDFRIYDFVDEYDDNKLPLIPNQLMDATSATNTDYTVNLKYLEQSDLFTVIRDQAIDSGNPREFKLFPRLVLPTPNLDLLDNCTLCGELPFDNASVEIDSGKFSDTERNVITCLKEIQELRTLGLIEDDELRNLYFYGYASKRGSHSPEMLPNDSGGKSNIGCTTNGCKGTGVDGCWAGCNYALSEDRSLSIIEELINGINSDSSFDPSIKVTKERTYTNRGFSNAKPDSMVDKSTHRLNRASQANILSLLNTSDPEFNFVSYPCGSDGAKKAYNLKPSEQLRDRYVLITPINNGDDYCENRMTCDMAKDAMETLKEKIKDRMNDKGIKAPKTTSTKKQSTTVSISFGSSSDGEYISTGEELDLLPGDAYQVASIIQALHSCREDIQSGKFRYPQICNTWIQQANELLGLDRNDGVVPNGDLNLTITRQKQLLDRYDSIRVKEVLKKLNFEYAII